MVPKELNDRLERSVQENSAMVELQTALNGERLRTCSSHVFTNPEFSICTVVPHSYATPSYTIFAAMLF